MKRHATYAERAYLTKGKRGRLDDAFAKRAALESWRSACRRGKKNAVSTSIYDRMNEYAAVR